MIEDPADAIASALQPASACALMSAGTWRRDSPRCAPTMPGTGPRVLMLSIVDPDFRRGGAWTVTRALLEWLRGAPWNAEVSVLTPRAPRWPGLRQASSVLAAPWTGVPAKVRYLRSGRYRRRVRTSLRESAYDLLVVNGSDLLWCLEEAPRACRTLAIVHNREAQVYADQVAATFPRAGTVRDWLMTDCARLEAFERARLREVDAAVFLSDAEARECARIHPGLRYMVLPPQFSEPPQRILKPRSARLDLGFLANFSWWPNRDGARWLVEDVLARVTGDVHLHLFGHGSRDVVAPHARVTAHGFVDDLSRVWSTCDWMVVPVRYGAGVSVKAAESLYHGMPLLSTHFGLRGLPPIDHPQVVRRDTADEWVAFLSGPEARASSGMRLPLELSGPFELRANASRMDRFLAGVLGVPAARGKATRFVDAAACAREVAE